MEVQASPATKQAVASLTALGINPMIPKKKPPTAEEAAAAKVQVELRKRARESEQAEQTAGLDLEDSDKGGYTGNRLFSRELWWLRKRVLFIDLGISFKFLK